ncbi:MAG: primosomal protein N' [Anaerolineae bacterium]|nr:primosomal protein N' [Anaerolineae bacterium]
MFAEIAVNRRVSQTFHYHIPPEFSGEIVPGHLVKVSFGTAHTTGIVIALHEGAPIPITKPILERLDPEPVVTPTQIALAAWLAEQTQTPLGLCLWLMLPPGLAQRGDFLYTLTDDTITVKSGAQQRIIDLLKKRGPLRRRQIEHAFPHKRWQSSLDALVRKEIVRKDPVLGEPTVKPKTTRTVRLTIPPERVPDIAPRLGTDSQQANILDVLLAAPEHRMEKNELMAMVDCSDGPIQALVESGDLEQTSRETWVELALPREIVRASLDKGDYKRAPAQTEALETLLAAEDRLPFKDLNANAIRPLEKAGTVNKWTDPTTIVLAIPPENVPARAIDLRGSQPYLDVLNFLAQQSEAVDIKTIQETTGADQTRLNRLEDDGLITFGEADVWRDPLIERDFVPTVAPPLTHDQAAVWAKVRQYMDTVHWGDISPSPDESGVFVLHGVTGSGKTEIYMHAVERVLAQGRQAIVMVPEIALTPQTVRRFAARFPDRVSIVHSELAPGERYDTWRRARMGEIHVIVGTRSALFVPLPDVGLVILDEEHDDSYKQSPPILPPYYHARDTAIQLMRITRGTVLLGSATPDVVTYARAERGEYTLLTLPDRIIAHRERIAELTRRLNAPSARYHPTDAADAVSAELPTVHVVDMRQELRTGNRSIFSRMLKTALNEVLARGEQAILFLNRRGTATFVMCRDCGYIAQCPRCSTPLTFHSPRHALICHYCNYRQDQLTVCPDCGSQRIKHFGQGTQLIESAVKKEFPHATTIRWDRDTATGREAHEIILHQFSERHADVLIGTQMIAKGLDLPQVTLVGIISADTALGLPDYRAGERTFQLLTQVAGRAGRGALGGRVVLQSYLPEHYAIQAAAEHDYGTFYRQEIAYRQEQLYPPFRRLVRIVFQYTTPDRAKFEAEKAKTRLEQRIETGQFTATEIIGPTPCFFAKRNNLYRWHIVVRTAQPAALLAGLDLPDEWFVDIDPVEML